MLKRQDQYGGICCHKGSKEEEPLTHTGKGKEGCPEEAILSWVLKDEQELVRLEALIEDNQKCVRCFCSMSLMTTLHRPLTLFSRQCLFLKSP